jgi:hypothetical protein
LQQNCEEKNLNPATIIPLDDRSSDGTLSEEGKPYNSSTNSSLDEFQNPSLEVPKRSALDLVSDDFSARAWMSNLAGFKSTDPTRFLSRTAGISFRNLNVYGFGTDYQKTVGNVFFEVTPIFRWMMRTGKHRTQILKDFDGLIQPWEMLLILGRPRSGCSTLLKCMSGDTRGLITNTASKINYQGISAKQRLEQFRGETIYMAETDVHFLHLRVGQTLLFAAKARAPGDFTFPGMPST